MSKLPLLAKLWLLGFVVLYAVAKVHTLTTMDEAHFLKRHWLFWAAMAAWAAVLALGGLIAERRKRSADFGTSTPA